MNSNLFEKMSNLSGTKTITADKIGLVQIVSNQLSNSIKFTLQREIGFGIMEISEQRITFFVSDTGIGIEKEVQCTIFERFRQANDSTTRLYGGTGLGLSYCKESGGTHER